MKKLLTITAITLLLAFSNTLFAQELDRTGSILTKLGVQGYFPTAHENIKDSHGDLIIDRDDRIFKNKFKNAIGAEFSASYFLTNNFAAELGISYTEYKAASHSFPDAFTYLYSRDGTPKISTTLKIKSIPVNFILQYHTPTLGIFQPYVGAGYSYAFLKGNHYYKTPIISEIQFLDKIRIKSKDAHGPVAQIGSNFDLGNNFGLNVDVKYFWLKPRYTISADRSIYVFGKESNYHSLSRSYKTKLNPVTVTLGLNYRF
ncbi:Outer membrane protein W [Rickettsiales bacterium Ac37b]|nr:Outer membrane protein W [Rickettsiales bacterium Ac37b]